MKGKKIVAVTALSALIVGGAFSYANTSNNTIQPPEAGMTVQEQVKKVNVPLDTYKEYGLVFDVDNKVIHDIGGNIIIQFKDGLIYDANGDELSFNQYSDIRKQYQGGLTLNVTDSDIGILKIDAYLAGVDPEGKTDSEIIEEVRAVEQMNLIKYDAEIMGIDISDLTDEEIKVKVDQEREVFIQNSIKEGIEQLKLSYQLDPEVYQSVGIDLTDLSDEDIKTMVYEIYENPSISIPLSETGSLSVWKAEFEIIKQFFDYRWTGWEKTLSRAKELGVDTFGHSIGKIGTISNNMETAKELGLDIEGKTSDEVFDMVQDYYKKKHMEETGKTEGELYNESV
ncbi:hypothetical protein [Chengkuizengella sediminis]|uniref:hypothetical protein n=1 Tax=Chengkuizengella sediminis TaxID=1885917 RepID=UPI0013893DA7|nr:hypothetical protein [Chengkuizengella sediminis]NDI34950.1 hypothetical protein [Chengkuizengella sediminis]